MSRSPFHTAALFGLFLAAGCAGGDDAEPIDAAPESTLPAEAMAPGEDMPADTTAAGLWAHLEAAQPAANWQMWPGTDRLYEGAEPHGMLLTTYVNALAYDALTGGAAEMPAGAIVVKENYMPDSTLAATTVMLKAPGYDSPNGDWFWLKRLPDGTDEVAGRGAGCIACHTSAPGDDMLYTALPGGGM